MNDIFHWFVKQGRIAAWNEFENTFLEIDTEGKDSCLLTLQDAIDISEILTKLSSEIWDSFDINKRNSVQGHYVKLQDHSFIWEFDDSILKIFVNFKLNAIEVNFNGGSVCKLSVQQTVEIIQILQQIVTNTMEQNSSFEKRKKWWEYWK